MEKVIRDLINRFFESELSEEEKEKLFKILKEDEIAFNYFKKLEILRKDLKEIKNLREKINLESKILYKIRKEKIKRKVSIYLGLALNFTLILLMIIPFTHKEHNLKISNLNKQNHKYTISNVVNNSNINEIELTLYVKDEKIEEKTGNLKIPREEFNLLFETLSDKGEILVEKIEGGKEKSDYISVKINYKNYPKKTFSYYLGTYLPYLIFTTIFLLPLFFILKRNRKVLL
ncbi:MAG: hypothetical protein N3D74_01875 [Caldisericia bacterium]|nr:hypothetical protein [Caldisericia bacterium]